MSKEFDLVIVGGGMAGAALACALAKLPISIALVEGQEQRPLNHQEKDQVEDYDSRVSAITAASRKFFIEIGVWDTICQSRHCAFVGMDVWDAEGTGSISFSAAEVNQTALGYIIENRIIIDSLYQRLQQYNNIQLLQPLRLLELESEKDELQVLTLDNGLVLHMGLVIGADGGNSRLRQLASIATRQWDYGHNAIVATVATELGHDNVARQRFLTEGPLAFLPLASADGHQRFCTIVWSGQRQYSQSLFELDDEVFREALGRAFEQRLGKVTAVSKRQTFPLHQCHAINYTKPGIVLVADAAHTIHPLAGQGINIGLLDVHVLAQEIETALQRNIVIGSLATLNRYQRRRKGANLMMMGAMEGFKRIFGEKRLPVRWLRNTGMSGIDKMPLLKRQIMKQAMGL